MGVQKRPFSRLAATVLSLVIAASMFGLVPWAAFGEQGSTEASTNSEQSFQLIVKIPTDGSSFRIPTSSYLYGTYDGKAYDWLIDWGDGSSVLAAGESSLGGGIAHSYTAAGEYTITIWPNGQTEAWMAAFGFCRYYPGSGSNADLNKSMLVGVPSSLTPQMTRTSSQITGVDAAPNNEWDGLFVGCANLVLSPSIAGWEVVTSVGDYFAAAMFSGCASLQTLNDEFNLPPGITSVGSYFAVNMMSRSGIVALPAGFNFPQGIVGDVDGFAIVMFAYCWDLITLPDGFNFPQGITGAGNEFAEIMFSNCTSLELLPSGFSFPKDITSVGDSFATVMFANCSNLKALPSGFTFPQGLIEVGDYFAHYAFGECINLIDLPAGFNLPQRLISVGADFASYMFFNCNSLGALPSGLNLPQGVQIVGENFASYMFYLAGGQSYQVNDEFCLPTGIPADSKWSLGYVLMLSDSAPMQNRTAASIIADCPTPTENKLTFDRHFRDLYYIPVNWGGVDHRWVGAPGSGDYDGDGVVTMYEALIAAQIAIGDINPNPDQFAALDVDNDGYITMADVIRIYQLAIQ